jgi:hypothetical protein
MYLKASAGIEFLDEYNGEKGQFVKTFALNDQRNKNGWRVTWESIKNNISDFSKNARPGIEYVKCENSICDLDHIDSSTYQKSLEIQEPFRKTTIIDYTLDENTHTSFFIHRVEDPEFFTKLQSQEIRFVSPAIWPISGEYTILGQMPNGLPKLDVYGWLALHDAFVNNPAFGDEAKIVATCEGEGCQMRLLTAKEKKNLSADELAPLEQIPILVRHKDHLTFVSTTKDISAAINELFSKESIPDIQSIMSVLRNNSFNACPCSLKSVMDVKELETALKAATDKTDEVTKKNKDLEARLAKLEAAIAACGKCGSTEHTTEEHTAENAMKSKKGKKAAKDPEGSPAEENSETPDEEKSEMKSKNAALEARLKITESELAKPLIIKMLAARKDNGMEDEQLKEFEKSLGAKSYEDIKTQFANEEILITAVSGRTEEDRHHFEFNGGQGALSAKSLEDVFEDTV